jgi:hypothetical protein
MTEKRKGRHTKILTNLPKKRLNVEDVEFFYVCVCVCDDILANNSAMQMVKMAEQLLSNGNEMK